MAVVGSRKELQSARLQLLGLTGPAYQSARASAFVDIRLRGRCQRQECRWVDYVTRRIARIPALSHT